MAEGLVHAYSGMGRSSSLKPRIPPGILDRSDDLKISMRSEASGARKVLLPFVMLVLLLLSAAASSYLVPSHARSPSLDPEQVQLVSANSLLPHAPILIDGDGGFTNASGVTWGSGTESDPYIIEGWDITTSTASAVEIRNTDVHFIVRDCLLRGTVHPRAGIFLSSCVNGTLSNNTMSGNYYAIYLASSSGIEITGNNCSNNWYGMFLADMSSNNAIIGNNCSNNIYDGIELYNLCNNNTIANNTFFDNLDGIHLETSYNNTLAGNTMVRNGMSMLGYVVSEWSSHTIDTSNTVNGRPLYYYKDQRGVTVPSDAGQVILANCTDFTVEGLGLGDATVGVQLAFSSNITIRGNSFPNSTYGVFLWYSDGNVVSDNVIDNNDITPQNWWYGIGLRYSSDNTVSNNTCSGSLYGISLGPSSRGNHVDNNTCTNNTSGMVLTMYGDNNTLVNNTFSYNSQYGVLLQMSSNNTLVGNNISRNTGFGVSIFSSSDNNRLWNNTFFGNNGAGDVYDPAHIQAFDAGVGNSWNSTAGYGNSWGDWRGPDLAPVDGIVDYPYLIGGSAGSWDYHPIAEYYGTPIPEFGPVPAAAAALTLLLALAVEGRRRRS